MIQTENPTQTLNNTGNHITTFTKVHGFSSSLAPTTVTVQQKIHPHRNQTLKEQFYRWWHKISIILLTAHGLIGIWESIKFIAIDYKELDLQLSLHLVQAEKVNQLVARALVVMVTTLVNIFMAVRLSKVRETAAHNIDLIIATILIISTKFIQEILIQFDLINLIINSF